MLVKELIKLSSSLKHQVAALRTSPSCRSRAELPTVCSKCQCGMKASGRGETIAGMKGYEGNLHLGICSNNNKKADIVK